MLLATEEATLDIFEEKVPLDTSTADGTIGVILAAARSSTFLAMAKVSTLLENEIIEATKISNKLVDSCYLMTSTYRADAILLTPLRGRS